MFPTIEELINDEPHIEKKLTAGALRRGLVQAFLDAMSESCKPSNVTKGFKCAGIYPLNPDTPLSHRDLPALPAEAQPQRTSGTINSTIVTDEDFIESLAAIQLGRELQDEDISVMKIVQKIQSSTMRDGMLLSPLPDLIIQDDGEISVLALE